MCDCKDSQKKISMKKTLLTSIAALFLATGTMQAKTIKGSSDYPQLQGTWHCELPPAEGQRKYAVHDNEYRIRGEFPVWGNGEGLTLTYTDDMKVIYFNGTPCQEIKKGQ
jgi:hypothetical protein